MSNLALRGRTAAVLIASDRCHAGTRIDRSGPALCSLLAGEGATVLQALVVPDDIPVIAEKLQLLAADAALVLTSGGTGLAPRDNTPEATLSICDRLVPGLAERIRAQGALETPFAALGRGICGIAGRALVINLPGSPEGAISGLRSVLPLLPHALDLLANKTDHAPVPAIDETGGV